MVVYNVPNTANNVNLLRKNSTEEEFLSLIIEDDCFIAVKAHGSIAFRCKNANSFITTRISDNDLENIYIRDQNDAVKEIYKRENQIAALQDEIEQLRIDADLENIDLTDEYIALDTQAVG